MTDRDLTPTPPFLERKLRRIIERAIDAQSLEGAFEKNVFLSCIVIEATELLEQMHPPPPVDAAAAINDPQPPVPLREE